MESLTPKTIIHLTSEHWHFDGRIHHKEAVAQSESARVVVLSGISAVPKDQGRKDYSEGEYDGVLVLSCDLQKEKPTLLRRVLKKLRLKKGWGYKKYFEHFEKKLDEFKIEPDLVILHDDVLLAITEKLKNRYKCPVIFDCHEHYYFYEYENYYNKGKIKKIGRILSAWKKRLAGVDGIISVNGTMNSINFLCKNDVPTTVIANKTVFNSEPKNIHGRLRLVHEGNMLFSRGLKEIISLFNDRWVADIADITIIGNFKGSELDYYNRAVKDNPGLQKLFNITGWVDFTDVPKYLNECHVGIVFFEKQLNTVYGLPNKLFNYLGMGLPVVAFDLPEIRYLITDYDVGVLVERNVESIKAGIKKIFDNYSWYTDNIKKSKNMFLWENERPKFLEFCNRIISKGQ